MPLRDIPDRALADNIERYRRAGVATGGPYSLAELLLEQRRRKPSPFAPPDVARKIVEFSRESPDGLTTYLQLWQHFQPGKEWQGHGSQKIMANSLARVIEYCVRHRLPIITVLVVQSGSRRLDQKAVQNIYEECRSLGIDVGPDPNKFVAEQAAPAT